MPLVCGAAKDSHGFSDKLTWLPIILFFLPSVAYDPEGFQKVDRLQKNYKISWNDLTPHQQSSHEEELC